MVSSGISTPFGELFRTPGQITHVLLTRAPLYSPLRAFSLDLHVLGTPPAFVLSQDQTLQLRVFSCLADPFGPDWLVILCGPRPCGRGAELFANSRKAGPHSVVGFLSSLQRPSTDPSTGEPSSRAES